MPSVLGHGRRADEKVRRCTATARSTGKRCGRYPTPGSSVCKYHGSGTPPSRRAIAWRTEIIEALLDGRPHPAVVFFRMMAMRWRLSDDGEFVVCEVPVSELGAPGDLSWINAWERVLTYSKLADEKYVDKRRGVRQRRSSTPNGGA